MKKLLLGFLLFTFLISCGNKKAKMDPFATITEMVDSAGHKADTLLEAEVKEEPKPMEADELFDDFIFNYASDDALQRQRTVFPLPYYNRDTPSKIEEEFWKHDYLFTKQNYYTRESGQLSAMACFSGSISYAISKSGICFLIS